MKYEEYDSELKRFYKEFVKRSELLDYWKKDEHGFPVRDRSGKYEKNPNFDPLRYQNEMTELNFCIGKYVPLSPLAFIFSLMLSKCKIFVNEEWEVYGDKANEDRKFSYDFFVPTLQLLIEVDGGKYHPLPGRCKFCHKKNTDDPEILENIKNQYIKERYAITSGYKFMRFLRDEIYAHGGETPIPELDKSAFITLTSELLDLIGEQRIHLGSKKKIMRALKEYSDED